MMPKDSSNEEESTSSAFNVPAPRATSQVRRNWAETPRLTWRRKGPSCFTSKVTEKLSTFPCPCQLQGKRGKGQHAYALMARDRAETSSPARRPELLLAHPPPREEADARLDLQTLGVHRNRTRADGHSHFTTTLFTCLGALQQVGVFKLSQLYEQWTLASHVVNAHSVQDFLKCH